VLVDPDRLRGTWQLRTTPGTAARIGHVRRLPWRHQPHARRASRPPLRRHRGIL